MLKVAHTITRLIGGPAYRTMSLMEYTNKDLFEQKLYYGSVMDWDPDDQSKILKDFPIKSVYIPEMQRNISPKKDIIALIKFIKEFKKFRPDIVHAHQSKDGVLARIAAIITGVPIILRTFHGITYIDNYYGKKTPYIVPIFISIEKVLAFLTSGIIPISEMIKDELVNQHKITKASKAFILYNSLELEPYLTAKKEKWLTKELSIDPDSLIITVVANFIPPKDHNNILEAFKIFLNRNSKLKPHLVLVGTGPLEEQAKKKTSTLKLDEYVHFLGHRNDIAQIYASSDVGMLGSFIEGNPASLIEAIASGIHVVATDVGAMRDTLNNGKRGTLAPPKNPEALANAIEKELATEKDFEKIKHEIKEMHDVKYAVKRVEDLYLRLAKEKGLID